MSSRPAFLIVPSLLATALSALAAAPKFTGVFSSGTEGYASIRIPAVLVTKAGSVLAFAEGRLKPQD